MTSPYSTSKALYFSDRLRDLAANRPVMPVHLQMILSDLCNQSCHFCAYRREGNLSNEQFGIDPQTGGRTKNPNRMIPRDRAIEIVREFASLGGRALQATGGGEPCLHPSFCEIMSLARSLRLKTSLVTNGSRLLDDGILEEASKCSWVRVSIDAGTMDTYCSTRGVGPSMWRKVTDGVRALASAIRSSGSGAILGVGFVATHRNWREMPDAVRLARSLGAVNVRLGLEFSHLGNTPHSDHRDALIRLAKVTQEEFTDDGFTVINRVREKLTELDEGSPDYHRCPYQFLTTYAGADGYVYRCCVTSYSMLGRVGSWKDLGFKGAWCSDDTWNTMSRFSARSCPRCQFTKINREINAVVSEIQQGQWTEPTGPPPLHYEFV